MKRSTVGVLAVASAAALAIAGCSSSTSGGKDKSPGTTSTSGGSYVATAQAAVDAAYKGLYTAPATGGPKAQTGKNIWVISCSQALPGCAQPTAGIQQAAKVLGWKITVADGGATPAGYNTAIRQAIAAKADGIISVAIDCPSATAALQAAKAAKIPTVGVYSYDCSDAKAGGGQSLYTALINTNGTPDQFGELWGKLKADYAIAATGGKAKIIQLTHPDFLVTQYQYAGYTAEIAKCSGCSVVDKVDITAADLGAPATTAQKTATALQQYPDANVLEVPDDTTMAEIAQAVKAAHRSNLTVIAGEGYPSTFDLIRSGVVTAAVAIPANWLGWSGADAMNRVLGGQTTIPNEGVSFQIIDAKHGLPAAGQGWTPSVNYEADFTANWKG